jgi:hypothetical protein
MLGGEDMLQEDVRWRMAAYEGFEIHAAPLAKHHENERAQTGRQNERNERDDWDEREKRKLELGERYTYIGYVCHPGVDPKLPGHSIFFHADGEDSFPSADAAWEEALHVGRTIVDGTHPDLTVLSLVTSGF